MNMFYRSLYVEVIVFAFLASVIKSSSESLKYAFIASGIHDHLNTYIYSQDDELWCEPHGEMQKG